MNRSMTRPGIGLAVLAALSAFAVYAHPRAASEGRPTITTQADFQRALKELSNWGGWGQDDELGSSNLITPAKRKQAVATVKDGVTVSLAHDVVEETAPDAQTVLNRYEFLFTAAPLRIVKGTGSPTNPIATF